MKKIESSFKKRIAIDVDGTIANQCKGAIEYIEKIMGLEVITEPEEIDTWNHIIETKTENILLSDFFKEKILDERLVYIMKPFNGVVKEIGDLAKKHHIKIITSRREESKDYTINWLKNNKIKYHEFCTTKRKAKCKLDVDILIEDDPYATLLTAKENEEKLVILISRPYNINTKWMNKDELDFNKQIKNGRIKRMGKWSEITSYILNLD